MEFAGEMGLAGSKDEKWARDLLSHLDPSSLVALSKTASGGRMATESVEEALDVIIITTPSLDKLLSYRKVTKQLLVEYLVRHNIPTGGKTKEELIGLAKKYWAQEENEVDTNPQSIPQWRPTVVPSDTFASQICSRFYGMLNSMVNGCEDTGEIFGPDVFCTYCSQTIYFSMEGGNREVQSQEAHRCYSALKEMQNKYHFSFIPNMQEGVSALRLEHGMIKVLSQGTLYMGECFIGIFEGEFDLVFDSGYKKWKMSSCKVTLEQTTSSFMEALPRPEIFEVEY